jgi:hypothetical protein
MYSDGRLAAVDVPPRREEIHRIGAKRLMSPGVENAVVKLGGFLAFFAFVAIVKIWVIPFLNDLF